MSALPPPSWPVPLDHPPRVLLAGRGVHGALPVERYHLPDLWCLHLYSYSASLRLDGHPLPIRPGHVSLVPPGTAMEYRYQGPSTHLFAHFQLDASPMPRPIPAMQDLGNDFEQAAAPLRRAVERPTPETGRLEAAVWSLLWRLVDIAEAHNPATDPAEHPAVSRARAWIEQHLAAPIRVADLAERCEISHNHLNRLFHQRTGVSVLAYIHHRRLALARHLLMQTTLPIKAVAARIGMSDLQQFNKYIRRSLGAAPRRLRNQRT